MLPANLNSCHIGGKESVVENQNKVTAIPVMPAIYRLTGLRAEGTDEWGDISKWGWHRADELLAAVQQILVQQGNEPLSTEQICEMYPQAHPQRSESPEPRFMQKRTGYLSVGGGNGQVWHCYSSNCDWLASHVKEQHFLPAKIGLRLIQAVKHPVLSRFI